MTGVLSNCFLLTLLYKTAVVKTPQSALWPIQNTTKRFVAYSKHHKALCGLFKHHKAQCGRHHYYSDYNLKLAEELSYFDREVCKISLQPFTFIMHAIFLLTRSFHYCCLSIV